MARPGITYPEVARVATQLTEQGVRPSIEAIRHRLGTGSNSTISRHLREWNSTQGAQIQLQAGLPESLLIAMKGIYDAMQETASEQLIQMTAEKEQAIGQLNAELKAMKTTQAHLLQEKSTLQATINDMQQKHAALERQEEAMKKAANAQKAEHYLLTERLNDKKSENERLSQLLTLTQANLDHYRQSMQQERSHDKQRFEKKIAALENQRQLHQQETLASKEAFNHEKQQVRQLEQAQSSALKATAEALKKIEALKHEQQALVLKLAQLQNTHDSLLSNFNALTKESASDKATLNRLAMETEKYKEQLRLQGIALNKAEDSLSRLGDKHLLLTQEKTTLAFQLKQVLETA